MEQPGSSQGPCSNNKVERRLVEKNRRNQMKILYSKLNSLLPNYNPKKKDTLLRTNNNKRSRGGGSSSSCSSAFPQLEIHEMGSTLEVVLTCGSDNQFVFHEIIRILHEENIEIRTANSSMAADHSVLHVLHAEIPQSSLPFGATKVSERLKRFVNGSSSDVEIQPELWDFEIPTHIWGF
ncbi:Helix-loop-helix DNA-binding domain superfamily [Sesbania bispinosa]|nr:Helix-loop-helix DNA-binding domain superfamily [Sesbania bispinosa]